MSRARTAIFMALSAAAFLGLALFVAYYVGFWPSPNIEVDDPAIKEWLQGDDVIVHRRGREPGLEKPVTRLEQGGRVDGACRWDNRISMAPGERGKRVLRVLATNRTTCERLALEGFLPN